MVVRGDLICRRVNLKRKATVLRGRGDYERLLPELAAYEMAAIDEMRKLTPPTSMANGWRQIIDGSREVAEVTEQIGQYAKQSQDFIALPAARKAGAKVAKASEKLTTVARHEGFTDCAMHT